MLPNPQFPANLVTFTEKSLMQSAIFCAKTVITNSQSKTKLYIVNILKMKITIRNTFGMKAFPLKVNRFQTFVKEVITEKIFFHFSYKKPNYNI